MQFNWQRALRRAGVTITAAGMIALAACGGSSSTSGTGNGASGAQGPQNSLISCPTSTSSTAAAPATGQVTIRVAGFSSSPAEDALVQQGLNLFMAANPTIKVTWNPIPTDYETKMRADIAAGSPADVFYVSPNMAQQYIPAGKLLNLSPYMARDNVAPSSFYTNLLQPFDCSNGSIYGIPKDWNTLGLIYNTTMFKAAGLGDPSNWTWTDLQNAAQKLTTNGVYGISLPSDASRFGAFLFANGGQMLAANGKSAAFNNTQGVAAATFYTSFYANKTGVRPADVGAGWDGEAFGKQEVAMTFEGGWMIPFMAQTYPNVQYSIAPLPMAPNGQRGNLIYTNAWGAYSGTQNPDAAWKVIQFMTAMNYQQQVLHDGFALPTIKSLESDSYFTYNPGFANLLKGAAYGHADFYGIADTTLHTEVANALDSIEIKGVSVTQALNTAATNVNTYITQNSAP